MIELPELIFSEYRPINKANPPFDAGVYIYADKDKNVIYIGKTKNLQARHSSHVWQKDIPGAKYYRYSVMNDMADIDIYETYYINKYLPKLNKAKRFTEESIDEEKALRETARKLGISVRAVKQMLRIGK